MTLQQLKYVDAVADCGSISEAARLGFKKIFISSYSSIDGKTPAGIRVVKVADVPELVKALFK